jgi:hypothetical protein
VITHTPSSYGGQRYAIVRVDGVITKVLKVTAQVNTAVWEMGQNMTPMVLSILAAEQA